MVLAYVLLGVLPELVVVLALDHVATDARNLLHPVIVRANEAKVRQPLAPDARGSVRRTEDGAARSCTEDVSTPSGPRREN